MQPEPKRIVDADYSREDGVTLVYECGHREFIRDLPRSPIPPCFRRVCKECLN